MALLSPQRYNNKMSKLTCYSGEYALKEYTEVKTVNFSSPL